MLDKSNRKGLIMKRGHNRQGGIAGEELRSLIERAERLEEEKAGIAEDIKELFAEAKGRGFDTKTMKAIMRLRKMGSQEREEYEALLDIYKAALGMLDGTPLGEAAIRKLAKPPQDEEPNDGAVNEEAAEEKATPEEAGQTVEEARDMARKAAAEGKPVTSNPFPARDPRRAAFDEAHCAATGSDGMEIPEAWRRSKLKKQPSERSRKGDNKDEKTA